jgi:uncharacterized protein (TIGR03067 family)
MKLRPAIRFLAMAVSTCWLTVLAADDAAQPAALPDYSKYTKVVKEVEGEVVSVDEAKLAVRVWTTDKQPKNGPTLVYGYQKEITYSFVPESLVRRVDLPARLDEKGKSKPYTEKEKAVWKSPKGAPGFAAAISDLSPGAPVSIALVREKTSAGVAKEEDLRIKFVTLKTETAFTRLQGVWHLDAIQSASKRTEYKESKDLVLTVRDDRWALSFAKDVVKDEQFLLSFGPAPGNVNTAIIVLDPATEPKSISLINPKGGLIWSGRYKVDNEGLTIARPLLGQRGVVATELKASETTILWQWRKSKDK